MDLPHLAGFLSGYLHQDWDVEYADARDAARGYAQDEASLIPITIEEIDTLRSRALPDSELAAWMSMAGCYYRPAEESSFDALLLDLRATFRGNVD